jgi:PPOX class probable F420-dependent enzyme
MTDMLQGEVDRLDVEQIGWLTTVSRGGQPQASPIWFLWHGDHIWLRSQAGAAKVANIRGNPRVAFHLDGDGQGGHIVTVEGTAEEVEELPSGVRQAYLAKYGKLITERLQSTLEQLEAAYPVSIRVAPKRARSW